MPTLNSLSMLLTRFLSMLLTRFLLIHAHKSTNYASLCQVYQNITTLEESPSLCFRLLLCIIFRGWSSRTLYFLLSGRNRPGRRNTARDSRSDDGKAVFSSFITAIGSSNIPDIRFKRITAAANAHFSEVTNGIFCFWKT